jgi:hypothetical protein
MKRIAFGILVFLLCATVLTAGCTDSTSTPTPTVKATIAATAMPTATATPTVKATASATAGQLPKLLLQRHQQLRLRLNHKRTARSTTARSHPSIIILGVRQ